MSGGSLEYAYCKVQEIADEIQRRATSPLHKEFAKHLEKVHKALYALEWVGK